MEPIAIIFMGVFWTLIISMSIITLRALMKHEKKQ